MEISSPLSWVLQARLVRMHFHRSMVMASTMALLATLLLKVAQTVIQFLLVMEMIPFIQMRELIRSLVAGREDVFYFASGGSTLVETTADTVTDFVSNTDTLKLGVAGDDTADTGNYVEATVAVADFDAALVAADSLSTLGGTSSSSQLHAFQFDAANGYLFVDTDGDGAADDAYVLEGIDNTEILHSDIIA